MEQQQQLWRKRDGVVQVLDGSEIRALVENRDAFARFVDDRFRKLDADGDGRLSVKELQPAVADIGAAIGLPARGIRGRPTTSTGRYGFVISRSFPFSGESFR